MGRAVVVAGLLCFALLLRGMPITAAWQFGSSQQTSLLIVDIEVRVKKPFWQSGNVQVEGGVLAWRGDAPQIVEGQESSGLVVFRDLKPGPYRLGAITGLMTRLGGGARQQSPVKYSLPYAEAGLAVDLKPGVPTYLGKVIVTDKWRAGRGTEQSYDFESPTPQTERAAWDRFLKKHGQTAWGKVVEGRLGHPNAPGIAPSPEQPAAAQPPDGQPSRLDRAGRLVGEVESAEVAGYARQFVTEHKNDLAEVGDDLNAHLRDHPDDVRALLLAIRLGRVQGMAQPTVLDPSSNAAPEDRMAPLLAQVEHALAIEPGNAEAHYWKARLYGVQVPTIRDGVVDRVPKDLAEALRSAHRAVELAPGEARYREALALYLVENREPVQALEVIRAGVTGNHPIAQLLSEMQAVPLPDAAIANPMGEKGLADTQMAQGHIKDYPSLRVRLIVVPTAAREVEAFYQRQWPSFKLFLLESEERDHIGMRLYGQTLRWDKGVVQPARTKKEVEAPGGLSLVVMEFSGMPPQRQAQAKFPPGLGALFCQVALVNLRPLSTP